MSPRRIYFCSMNRDAHLPLVWGCLRAEVESDSVLAAEYRFEAPFFFLEQRSTLLDRVENPYLLLLSCYVWNLQKNLLIARAVKERWPNVLVVAGGPQVPDHAELLFQEAPFLDFAIHNEGETPFRQLLHQLLCDRPNLGTVPGLSWRTACGGVRTNPLCSHRPKEIDTPSPWLRGYFDPCIEEVRTAGLSPVVLWETNRGCPYSCTFCDWGSANMSKLRTFPFQRLMREIEWFGTNRIEAVLCCDANFGILKRDIDLAQQLAAIHHTTGYPRRFVTSYAKNPSHAVVESSRILVKSNLSTGIILAMQSTNTQVLEAVRRSNIPFDDYRRLSHAFRQKGIHVYTELILGLPGETKMSWIHGLCQVLDCGIHDDVMIYECVVLPNSQLGTAASRELHGLITMERPYLMNDVERVEIVIGSRTMNSDEWVECWLFSFMLQALHNLGLVRQIAIYLHREGLGSYETIYTSLFKIFHQAPGTVLGAAIERLERLMNDYMGDPSVPSEDRIRTQPDMLAICRRVVPTKRDWLLHEWCWAKIVLDIDRFFLEITQALDNVGVSVDPRLRSLLAFQRDSVLTVDYDPIRGKIGLYDFDWPSYFADDNATLREKTTILRYAGPPLTMRPGLVPGIAGEALGRQ